jgi:hypothetical protein
MAGTTKRVVMPQLGESVHEGTISKWLVKPGDNVLIDGGVTSMTYLTELKPTVSGTAAAPIIIRLAPDSGRNGQVIIFGGRTVPLPYCEQATYAVQTGVVAHGLEFSGQSYITVDGTKWSGILLNGHSDYGVNLDGTNNTLKYMEITDNGQANFIAAQNFWRPDQPGVHPSGSNLVLDHMNIHDNGQDSLQTGGAITNMRISYSWFHNARSHPVYGAAVASNYCMHSDGFQIYNGGTSSGISIDHSILGPGKMQGVLFGQDAGGTSVANVTNASISNVLVLASFVTGIAGYSNTASTNWTIDHTTVYTVRSPNWKTANPGSTVGNGWNNSISVSPISTGLRITNSIAVDGRMGLGASPTLTNNCNWSPYGSMLSGSIGTYADPQMASPPPLAFPDATAGMNSTTPTSPTLADEANADYRVTAGTCLGKGSSITSVAQLLAQ